MFVLQEMAEEIPLTKRDQQEASGPADVENGKENGCNGKENVEKPSAKPGYFSSWTLDTFSTVLFPAAYVFFHLVFYSVILGWFQNESHCINWQQAQL